MQLTIEYCDGGSCIDIVRKRNQTFSDRQIQSVMKQAIRGLAYIHAVKICHRDIKARPTLSLALSLRFSLLFIVIVVVIAFFDIISIVIVARWRTRYARCSVVLSRARGFVVLFVAAMQCVYMSGPVFNDAYNEYRRETFC